MKRKTGLLPLLVRAAFPGQGPRRWPVYLLGALLVALAGLSPIARASRAVAETLPIRVTERPASVDELLSRAAAASRSWRTLEGYWDREVAPVERVLLGYGGDARLARRIAVALVREAHRSRIEPQLLLAVLLVENPTLNPSARSSVGATGLMQVMPAHKGKWGCRGELEHVETSICYGARVFAMHFRDHGGDVDRALLAYNGCVRGTNTPNCHTYPYHVYARAGRASIMAWLRPQPARAAAP